MDLLLSQFRAAYRENPRLFVAFFILSAIAGLVVGYRFFGPAIFG